MVRTGTEAWTAIRSELVAGFAAGESIDDLSARLRGVSEISQRRARTVARTEVIGASNAGAMAGASTFPELQPETKTWLATSDARTRPTHQTANGQTVPFDKPFDVGGYSMMQPHALGAPAKEVVNCRCTVVFSDPAPTPEPLVDPRAAPVTVNNVGTAEQWAQTQGFFARQEIADRAGADLVANYNGALSGTGHSTRMAAIRMNDDGGLSWTVHILDDAGNQVGEMTRVLHQLDDGSWSVEHTLFEVNQQIQGQGLGARLNSVAEDYYRSIGANRVSLHANVDVGGYAWARQGYGWDPAWEGVNNYVNNTLVRIRGFADDLPEGAMRNQAIRDLDAISDTMLAGDLPTPFELSRVGYVEGEQFWPGKMGMLNTSWNGVKLL
jgi:GNAT superfamily N-acetyltransferase